MAGVWGRALAVWLLIVVAESIHGTLRVLFLQPLVGDFPARRLAVFSGMAIIFAISWLGVRWIGARGSRQWLAIGAAWVALIVAFEVGLGRLVMHLSWDRILEDYDPSRGGLMLLGLAVMGLSPWAAARWRAAG
ncbi:MAG: hypothetical protein JNK22_01040 [Rhodocyclaceae bacterium]|nr:hypothetical protein [Rhodocyclaceae bacterium]